MGVERRLPHYYRSFDLNRLAQRFIFASDWPSMPGIARDARAIVDLGFDRPTLEKVFWRNANDVYNLKL